MAKKAIGVLVLHGFAASLDSVNNLEGPLRYLNLPVRIPVLRGHGANSPDALQGVAWRDWVADAENAMRALLVDVQKVIVIGHGMGSLLAITLAANNRDKIDSLVLAAPSVYLPSPVWNRMKLQVLSPIIQRTFPRWSLPPSYTDKKQARSDTNYHWAPMDAIRSFLEFRDITRMRLMDVHCPVLILQSRNDSTVSEDSPKIISNSISTPAALKKIKWFTRSEHELFRDCERDDVIETIAQYVMGRVDNFMLAGA